MGARRKKRLSMFKAAVRSQYKQIFKKMVKSEVQSASMRKTQRVKARQERAAKHAAARRQRLQQHALRNKRISTLLQRLKLAVKTALTEKEELAAQSKERQKKP